MLALYRNHVPPRLAAVLGVLLLVALAIPAFAADAVSIPGAVTSTVITIDLGWFAKFAELYVTPTLGGIVALMLGRLYVVLKQKWGIDIDAGQRDALQTAIVNAAGLLIAKGVHMSDGKVLDPGNALVAQAVRYAQDAAPGALKHFGLGPDDVAQKIVAKLGVLAAPPPPIPANDAAAAPAAPAAPLAGLIPSAA